MPKCAATLAVGGFHSKLSESNGNVTFTLLIISAEDRGSPNRQFAVIARSGSNNLRFTDDPGVLAGRLESECRVSI